VLGAAAATTAAVAGSSLLGACGSNSDGRGSSRQGSAVSQDELLDLTPTYRPIELVPPDLPATEEGAMPGYTSYPQELVQAIEEPPGTGGDEFTATTPAWWPIPPGLGDNSYYDAVNAALNATIRFNIVSGTDYRDRLAAILAAGDITDLMVITDWDRPAGFSEAVTALFAPLTEYLAGDAALEYPHLAALPSRAWTSGVWNGELYGIPFTTGDFPFALFYRADILEEMGIPEPRNADEIYEFGREVTDARAGRWAFGDMLNEMVRAFGAPQDWRVENGELVNQIETEEYAAAVEFTRRLYTEGLVHPDIVAGAADVKQLFESGALLMYWDGLGGWREALQRQLPVNPNFRMQPVAPYAADGGEPIYYYNEASTILTYLRKDLSRERIEEILRILNYISSPFGTQEHFLIEYGVEGQHNTRGTNGAPTLTSLGQREVTITYRFLSGMPPAVYQSEFPGYVEAYYNWHVEASRYKRVSMRDGLHIEEPSHLIDLGQRTQDRVLNIVRGREPLEELENVVNWWRRNGGDELRDFYTEVFTDAGRM